MSRKEKERRRDKPDEEDMKNGEKLKRKEYDRELEKLHVELVKLQEWTKHKGPDPALARSDSVQGGAPREGETPQAKDRQGLQAARLSVQARAGKVLRSRQLVAGR